MSKVTLADARERSTDFIHTHSCSSQEDHFVSQIFTVATAIAASFALAKHQSINIIIFALRLADQSAGGRLTTWPRGCCLQPSGALLWYAAKDKKIVDAREPPCPPEAFVSIYCRHPSKSSMPKGSKYHAHKRVKGQNAIPYARLKCQHVTNTIQNERWGCQNVANTFQNERF